MRLIHTLAAVCPLLVCHSAAAQISLPVPKQAIDTPALGYLNPANKQAYDTAHGHFLTATKGLVKLMEASESRAGFAKLKPTDFTAVGNANITMRIHGRWLEHMGEPAGFDFQTRSQLIERVYELIAREYRTTPPGTKFNAGVRAEFGNKSRQMDAAYQQANKLASQGKFKAAEDYVEDVTYKWRARSKLLDPAAEGPYYAPFGSAVNAYRAAMEKERRAAALVSLEQLRNSLVPNVDALLAGTKAVVDQVGKDGQASFEQKMVAGPVLYSRLAFYWKQYHNKLNNAEGVEMARCAVGKVKDSSQLQQIRAAHDKLTEGMTAELARLIESEASRGNPDLYHQYNAAAAALVVNAGVDVAKAMDAALGKLAAKSDLAGIGKFNIAMNDMLRWRRIAAEARAEQLRGQYPDARNDLLGSTRSRSNLQGLFPERDSREYPELLGSVPEVHALAMPIGKQASAGYLAPGAASASTRDSRLIGRVFATAPAKWDIGTSLEQLKADLLVTDDLPPLTLMGAAAIRSAESGGFVAVGGKVDGMVVRSLLQLKASMQPEHWNRIPLGPLPDEQPESFLNQSVLNVQLIPAWLQHEYFLIPASPQAPQS